MPGSGLKRVAAGQHDRDDHPGQVLPDGQRARHGRQRDQVHADIAMDEVASDADRQRHQDDPDANGPDDVGDIATAADPRGSAEPETRNGDRQR